MKRSQLKEIIKEELKSVLKEGTWALPKSKSEQKKAYLYVQELDKFKKKIYNMLGDDELFDHLDNAIKRMNELIQAAPTGKNWDGNK